MTSMGTYRHLSRCSTDTGHFMVLAIDHREILLNQLNKYAPQPLTDAEFTSFKQQIISAANRDISAVLVDPAYGLGAGIATRTIRGQLGILTPLEVTNYSLHPSQQTIDLLPDWSIEQAKQVGSDGVKLLLPYHPDADNAEDKHDIVAQIVEHCQRLQIPFFLEPIVYSLDPTKPVSNADLREISVSMARRFCVMGVDVLKLQFPVDTKQSSDEAEWRAACDELNAACNVPWAILSGGVDYPTFAKQVRIACEAGASGVIVGRAVWAEAVALQGAARTEFITTKMMERVRELAQICEKYAHPWMARVVAPDAAVNWYAQH
ncbi:MAG: tagatose 1,6-diphosphate aldolase [Anaerolineae bacterium]|nr:tagatose 1,6-diphosphate aldolase [Anaerolineae bacterium]